MIHQIKFENFRSYSERQRFGLLYLAKPLQA